MCDIILVGGGSDFYGNMSQEGGEAQFYTKIVLHNLWTTPNSLFK